MNISGFNGRSTANLTQLALFFPGQALNTSRY